jgi:hypothetical protein
VTKAFIVLVGGLLFVLAWGPVCLYLLAPKSSRSEVPFLIDLIFAFGAICLPIVAVRFMKRALTAKVVWSADSIEVFGRKGRQILRTDDLVGKRPVRQERGRNFALVSKGPNASDVVVSLDWVLPFDPDFKTWINSIPNIQSAR